MGAEGLQQGLLLFGCTQLSDCETVLAACVPGSGQQWQSQTNRQNWISAMAINVLLFKDGLVDSLVPVPTLCILPVRCISNRPLPALECTKISSRDLPLKLLSYCHLLLRWAGGHVLRPPTS